MKHVKTTTNNLHIHTPYGHWLVHIHLFSLFCLLREPLLRTLRRSLCLCLHCDRGASQADGNQLRRFVYALTVRQKCAFTARPHRCPICVYAVTLEVLYMFPYHLFCYDKKGCTTRCAVLIGHSASNLRSNSCVRAADTRSITYPPLSPSMSSCWVANVTAFLCYSRCRLSCFRGDAFHCKIPVQQ